jgi:hypothetical protein
MTTPVPIPDLPPANSTAMLCGPWASPSDIPEGYRAELTDGQWEQVIGYASEILYLLSGKRWRGAGCTDSVILRSRPAAVGSGDWPYRMWDTCGCWGYDGVSDLRAAYAWSFLPSFGLSHPTPQAIDLGKEATSITSVTVAGDLLDPSAYRLTDSGWLDRVDGRGWSLCGPTGPTTVVFDKGNPPPPGGVRSAVLFAIELEKAWTGADDCALPTRMTQVTRQGVSVTVDPAMFLDKLRTGIPIVDQWLAAVNPKGRARGGSVWSPDTPRPGRG